MKEKRENGEEQEQNAEEEKEEKANTSLRRGKEPKKGRLP